MDVKKVLFISQEITPYLPDSPLAAACRELPQGIQERGFEVRTFMPKYGCINERRNQLHEVIRLSGMNLIIDDTDHPLIIKVATLQPARMQVYFIFNDDYFSRNVAKDLETVTSPEDNDERCIFFVRGVIETVKKLRWKADVVHCAGWISALAPVYLKDIYNEDPEFRDTKVVYALHDDAFEQSFDPRFVEKMQMDGILPEHLEIIKDGAVDYVALTKFAISQSDGVIQSVENVNPEILKFVEESGKPFLPYQQPEAYIDACAEFYKSL